MASSARSTRTKQKRLQPDTLGAIGSHTAGVSTIRDAPTTFRTSHVFDRWLVVRSLTDLSDIDRRISFAPGGISTAISRKDSAGVFDSMGVRGV